MNYDDERVNKTFTLFCYGVLIALAMGIAAGSLLTYFLVKQ